MWNRYSVRRRSLSSRREYRFQKAVTFYQTVGLPSNFYRSFRNLFYLEWMWNHYSVRRRSQRSRPAYRFERPVTFDAAVGSPSNLYRSFGRCFPCSRCGIAARTGGGLCARDQRTRSKGPSLLIRPLDRPQIFTGVSRRRFPCSRCGIATL